jgi:hypothetical protein
VPSYRYEDRRSYWNRSGYARRPGIGQRNAWIKTPRPFGNRGVENPFEILNFIMKVVFPMIVAVIVDLVQHLL